MSVLKTLIWATMAVSIVAPGVRASTDLASIMAGCVGRYSAQLEHAWLMNDPSSAALERRRAIFLSILDAAMPEGAGPRILHHRIEAKHAQARLLTSASFDTHQGRATWSKRRARIYIERCSALILDS